MTVIFCRWSSHSFRLRHLQKDGRRYHLGVRGRSPEFQSIYQIEAIDPVLLKDIF